MFATLGAKIALGLGLFVLITGVAGGAIWYIYDQGKSVGTAAVTQAVQAKTIDVQRKEHAAEQAGPKTQSDVSKRLHDHTF